MKKELGYEPVNANPTERVMLEEDSHQCARWAVSAAINNNLTINIHSLSDILKKVPEGQDPIQACADATGTRYEGQLKSTFASDAPLDGQHRPNVVIGVTRYSTSVDYRKMADVRANYGFGKVDVGHLTSRGVDLRKLKVEPGFGGIYHRTLWVPALFSPGKGEDFEPYTDAIPGLRIVDESIRELEKFVLLVGTGKADDLVVVSGDGTRLGNKVDAFFDSYFQKNWYTIADIKR